MAATTEVDPVSSAAPPHRPLQKKTLHLRRAARSCSSLLLRAVVLPRRLSAGVQRPPSPVLRPLALVAFSAEPLCPTSWAGGHALAWAAPPSASRYISPSICVLLLPTAPQPRWGETANTYGEWFETQFKYGKGFRRFKHPPS